MKTKALIYCRVSSPRQVKEGDGLGSQEQRCRKYAENAGYKIIGVFKEKGLTGGLFDRPAMKEVLKCLEDNDINDSEDKIVVIFDDLKRFARDTEVHFALKREIYGRNGRVESPNFRFEDTPEGKFVETVMAATSELEKNQNKRQVIQKMKARLERGYWPFCMPKGLINKKDPIHGKILVRREPYATIYKEGIEKYRDGILPSILNFQAFCNAKYKEYEITHIMSFSTATATLKEILYAGYIEYPKWNVVRSKGQHEGFISIDTYEIVQERLQGRAKPWRRKDYNLDFPLRPHVLCDKCGVPMSGAFNTGRKGQRYPHYYCRGKGCEYIWKSISKEKFEDKFEILLARVKPADDLIELTRDVLLVEWNNRLDKYSLVKSTSQNELIEIKGEIDDLVERVRKTKDQTLIDIYEGKIKELAGRKEEREKNLRQNIYTNKDFGTASEKVFNTLKKPLEMWQSNDYNDKRTILFMYFEDKLRYDYFQGFGTANLAYPLELITKNPDLSRGSVEMSSSELESKKLL